MNKNVKLDKLKVQEVKVHGISHEGRGIATIANKTTFITGVLPKEEIICKVTTQRANFNEAELTQLVTTSENRVTPPCPHFGVCGGCNLQHMSMPAQLELKQQTLLDQLFHFGKVTPESILPPLSATTLGYRRKARLGVKFVFKKNKLLVGFREKKSRYLADLLQCVVLVPEVGLRLTALSALISSLDCAKQIPQVEVAMGDKDVVLIFRHLEPYTLRDEQQLTAFGKKYNFHIYMQANPPKPLKKIWPLSSNDYITYSLPDYALEFLFHPLDFTQINLEVNRLMVSQALDLLELKPTDKVLDLFCGIGNFSLPMAKKAAYVTGIEGNSEMVNRAYLNAKHNHINNIDFYVENLTTPEANATWLKQKYHKILLDPPRTGAKEILPLIVSGMPEKICYVSCNPATLSRDAGELVHEHGYRLQAVGIMNMFPHTAHIEAMALFQK